MVTGTTSTAEWVGSSAIGLGALFLLAFAAKWGADKAHVGADRAREAYLLERAARQVPPAPSPTPLDIPRIPAHAPAYPAHDQTLQLTEVRAYRARHRKGHAA